MTSGEYLKDKLGLNKLKYVQIARLIASPVPIYIIFFDSYRISLPITSYRVKNAKHFVAMLYNGKDVGKVPAITPLVDINDYRGNINGILFLTIDLAGDNLVNQSGLLEGGVKSLLNNKLPIYYGNLFKFLEYTIKDFRSEGVSSLTKKHFDIRQKEGNPGLTLENVIWDEIEDSLLVEYFVIPTFEQKVNVVDFKGNFKKDNHYETEVLFENVSQYLGTKKDFLELSRGNQVKKLRDMIKNADVLLHSNSPVWYWQGHFEHAEQEGYALYPFQGKSGSGYWQKKHDNKKINISKHIFSTLQVIPFTVTDISKMIRDNN